MTNPLLSVVVTTYNQKDYIGKALDSILMQQTDFDFEIIVSDDASPDCTPEIVKQYAEKYPDKITAICRKENVGISVNWFETLLTAKGEYVTTLEGDDYWTDPLKLQKQVDFLKSNPQYIGVSTERIMADDNGKEYEFFTTAYGSVNKANTINSFLGGITFSYTATVHKNIFRDDGEKYCDFVTANRSIADFALCCIILSKGNVFVLPDITCAYRIAGETKKEQNYSSKTSIAKKYADSLQVVSIAKDYFANRYPFDKCLSVWSFMPFVESLSAKQLGAFFAVFKKISFKAKLWCVITWPCYALRIIKYKLSKGR